MNTKLQKRIKNILLGYNNIINDKLINILCNEIETSFFCYTNKNIFLQQIYEKFSLNDIEKNVFSYYVSNMHYSCVIPFLHKILDNKRSYIERFLGQELKDFRDLKHKTFEIYIPTQDSDIINIPLIYHRKKQTILYDMLETNNPHKLIYVYNRILSRLNELSYYERKYIYKVYFGFQYDKVRNQKEIFYLRYKDLILDLDKDKVENFIDDLFDKNINAMQVFDNLHTDS